MAEKLLKVEARATPKGNGAACYLYGDIGGYDGISALDFKASIDTLGSIDSLELYINSPGGSVFEAKAIIAQIDRISQKCKVTAIVDGLAASAASLIAVACPRCEMYAGAKMMIHMPHAMAAGSAQDLRKMADLLDGETDTLVNLYQKKSRISAKKVREMMAAETYMTATEAVSLGFADKVCGESDPQASATNSRFQSVVNTTKNLTSDRHLALWKAQRSIDKLKARASSKS